MPTDPSTPASLLPEPAANPELVGHGPAVQALERALASGRLPHGWLLFGHRGIGKATLAYRFARVLLAGPAVVGPGLDLPADHPVFRQVAAGSHPDLKVIAAERDPRTGKIKAEIPVDRVRAVTAALHTTPAIAKRRVLIVDGAEQLNRNAANALLKPLEEPPADAVLILVSHRLGQVAATLRSRCAKLALGGLDDALVEEHLRRHAAGLDQATLAAITAMAKGSLGRALELALGDWIGLYRRLLGAVAKPEDLLGLAELAAALAKHAARDGFGATTGLVQTLLGRLVAAASGIGVVPLFEEEQAALARLAGRRPLDQWAVLWEKIARLSAAVDGLNLDHTEALLQILSAMASVPAPDPPYAIETSLAGEALLGEHHVVG
jgi:DNA polymerase-3 subunit delta'